LGANSTSERGTLKIKKLPDGKLFIQFKFNPSEDLLSTPDEIAALGDDDEIALLFDAVISIVDTEVRTIIFDEDLSKLSVTIKKKLRKKKLKEIAFADIKQMKIVEKKKKNAIFLETTDGEKELIAFHKRARKVKKVLKQIEEIFGPNMQKT
jgi:hypothetical protein